MKLSFRFVSIFLLVFALTAVASAQSPTSDGASATLARSTVGYADKAPRTLVGVELTQLQAVTSATILDFPVNADSSRGVFAIDSGIGSDKGAANTAGNGPSALNRSFRDNDGRRRNLP